ncbi:2-aminoethylphosphonate-pyruvate transaminase [Cytobacillus horneckiae]|uniref:2-aminoethylphosphonate--pyruvate transaminase n=1 Tax=Cytobacillus horneckiae TaxID=549687 RepID=A0A2N0ZEX0_9BACI|nr:2-aminoethylphosphonate--pyruvate transaminase [Cytobacillus horneckiae]MBN6889482.1 2-aminoethylphosphonate--pyruvate transaminase [Cytobacillus horneckiae]MCM3176833.1 2-aminoethylphosphonate--pyruvate transaminase [Cytobacillus horneckiae]MEC1156675.1 2-aminoethylphosphonate--pyruvate transaminase [Cytobacillus horneckiae]MED2939104.1 2-aminoethylphosphonate--pyruvate transaminase [Cytobacillus horneckiae]PKG28048.1 2-aminoethylphosphonate--pyruvate transaminase [Cytobacillus horneckiae]
MKQYKLLTPGPLTTTKTVKEEMLFDRCTWDSDYKEITQKIRRQLLDFAHASAEEYTVVLMQGSGTFAVESVMTTAISNEDKALIITNGAYGERIVKIADYIGLNFVQYAVEYNEYPNEASIRKLLAEDESITHIVMVHCETTTGILNPIDMISSVAQDYGKTLIIDAMSSFGGVEMNVPALGIDYLISSANKCIQGVPGFGFVIAKKEKLAACEGNARSLSLDLFDQWKEMNKDGKWRYTSPTHVVAAFSKAIDELIAEGGIASRQNRYTNNNKLLRERLAQAGFATYITEEKQSPIITSFIYPTEQFSFDSFYHFVKEKGFVIYPGKLTDADTFRIGNIGEIDEEDISDLCNIIEDYMGVRA